jgi:dihydrofolate reductase
VAFSKTLDKADWPEAEVARGDITEEITALKQQPGGDLVAHDGPTFVHELSRRGIVDLYRLVVQPGAVGLGSPFFKDLADTIDLELLDARPFPSGAIGLVVYQPRTTTRS